MAKATMTVYEELLATAAMKAPKDPNEQVFLIKLFKAINDLPEDEWTAMSEDAQAWSNKAAKAKTADKAYPKVPGAEAEEEDDPEASGDGADGSDDGEAPVAKKTAKKAPAKKAAAPAKKAAAPAAKKAAPAAKKAAKKGARAGEKPVKSMSRACRELICKAPHLTVTELIAKLEALHYEAAPITISTFRSDTRAVLTVIQDLNIDVKKLDLDK